MRGAVDWTEGPLGALRDRDGGTEMDADALRAAVAARADAMAAAGAEAGTLVAIVRDGGADALVDLLAAWRLGAAAAMLDVGLSDPERENVLDHARPALVCDAAGMAAPTGAPRRWDGPARDRPALLLFTSGTTGTPKAVVLTMRALEARVALNHAQIGREALSVVLQTLPLHFGHGLIGSALTTLAAGGTLVLPARGGLGPAAGLGATIDAEGVTFLTSVPTLWRAALRMSSSPEGATLRRVHVGSAPLSAQLWERIAGWCGAASVWNCYGITETANWIGGAAWPAGDAHVGHPWGGAFAVAGPDGTPRPAGEGEVLYRGPATMSGYLDRPDATAAVLRGGWYATGDTGRLGPDGLALSGRLREEINRAGVKVQPADVDRVVEAHPGVAECCCFALPDPIAGETVAAAYVPEAGHAPEAAELAAFCAARLRPVAVPERWLPVEAIPRTPRGKVSRRAVAEALA